MLSITKDEFTFYLTWTFYLCSYTLLNLCELAYVYDVSNIYTILRNISLVLFSLLAISGQFKVKRIPVIVLVAVATILSVFGAHAVSFLMILIIGLAIKSISIKRFIRFDIGLRIVLLLTIFLLCATGIVDNYTTVTSSGLLRPALGFVHPNTLGIFVATIFVEWLYLNFDRKGTEIILVALVLIAALSYIHNSRTVRILLAMEVIFVFILRSKRVRNFVLSSRIVRNVIILSPVLICVLCYISAFLYNSSSPLWVALDSLFSTRIHFASKYYNTYGLSLFGQDINPTIRRTADLVGEVYSNSFDMSYVRIGVEYGIVILLLFVICLALVQRQALINKNWPLLIANIYFVLLGVTENALYNICLNPFLVYIVFVLLDNLQIFEKKRNKSIMNQHR